MRHPFGIRKVRRRDPCLRAQESKASVDLPGEPGGRKKAQDRVGMAMPADDEARSRPCADLLPAHLLVKRITARAHLFEVELAEDIADQCVDVEMTVGLHLAADFIEHRDLGLLAIALYRLRQPRQAQGHEA